MADEKGNVDIFVMDNNINQDYVSFLRENGFDVDVITGASENEKKKFCETKAKVLIFGYGQSSSHNSGEVYNQNSALGDKCPITGVELAKIVQWSCSSKYVHIVSSHASEERPPGCECTWAELVAKKIISSYSGRDRKSFSPYLHSIDDALKNRD